MLFLVSHVERLVSLIVCCVVIQMYNVCSSVQNALSSERLSQDTSRSEALDRARAQSPEPKTHRRNRTYGANKPGPKAMHTFP